MSRRSDRQHFWAQGAGIGESLQELDADTMLAFKSFYSLDDLVGWTLQRAVVTYTAVTTTEPIGGMARFMVSFYVASAAISPNPGLEQHNYPFWQSHAYPTSGTIGVGALGVSPQVVDVEGNRRFEGPEDSLWLSMEGLDPFDTVWTFAWGVRALLLAPVGFSAGGV